MIMLNFCLLIVPTLVELNVNAITITDTVMATITVLKPLLYLIITLYLFTFLYAFYGLDYQLVLDS